MINIEQVFKISLTASSQLESNIVGHLLQLVDEADRNQDGKIDLEEWRIMGKLSANLLSLDNTSHNAPLIVAQIKKRIPMAQKHLEKIRDLFQRYDTDKDDSLNLNELALLLQEISSKISPLPAVSLPSCILLLFSLLNERTDCTSRISTREVPREQAQQTCTPEGRARCERYSCYG